MTQPRDQRPSSATPVGETMTIGQLSERTGVPVKQIRRFEDLGFIYTVGRSAGNYRLFDESALWCVGMVSDLRSVGLTLAEIGEIVSVYLTRPDVNVGPLVAEKLAAVRERTSGRIDELQQLLGRIDAFETANRAELAGQTDFGLTDPRHCRDDA